MPDLAIDGLNLEKSIGRYLSEQNWDKDHRLSERTSEESIRRMQMANVLGEKQRERERERASTEESEEREAVSLLLAFALFVGDFTRSRAKISVGIIGLYC